MTAWFAHRVMRLGARCAVGAVLVAAAIASPASAADAIDVFIDQATLTKLPDHTATIVIGNPLIADVTLQPGGLMVVTGKGYGATNVIALDRAGAVLSERIIQVQGPQGPVVVVYRGINRESYSCAPMCERRITLGDTPDFFDATLGQTGTRNQRAIGQGQTAAAQQ